MNFKQLDMFIDEIEPIDFIENERLFHMINESDLVKPVKPVEPISKIEPDDNMEELEDVDELEDVEEENFDAGKQPYTFGEFILFYDKKGNESAGIIRGLAWNAGKRTSEFADNLITEVEVDGKKGKNHVVPIRKVIKKLQDLKEATSLTA